MKNLRIHNKVITAGNMNYLQRQQQLQHGIEEHYRELHIPPGNPTQKPYWGQPEQTGEPIPTVAGNYEIPRGWPREPIFNPPGGPPGPPIQFGEPQTTDNLTAGYGYIPNSLEERDLYFYHPDHLGSTSIITDKVGVATQFVAYMPFGEPLVDEHVSRKEMPYKFNGKEIDEETGLYYYGARYYDAGIGVWYGTDLMQEKYPNVSTYAYCANNPIMFIDPDGNAPIPAKELIARLNYVAKLATFEKAWQKSNHGGATVAEWGFTITISSDSKWYIGRNLHTDNKGGSVSRNSNVPSTEKLIGFAHTHPYSLSEGSFLGAGFSSTDLANMKANAAEGKFFTMVEAGTKRYAAIISDPEKAVEFFKNNSREDIINTYNTAFNDPKNSKLSFQQRIDKGILAVVGNSSESGITVFVAEDKNKNNFKPLE
jgi:RHS repeat-associated protein